MQLHLCLNGKPELEVKGLQPQRIDKAGSYCNCYKLECKVQGDNKQFANISHWSVKLNKSENHNTNLNRKSISSAVFTLESSIFLQLPRS